MLSAWYAAFARRRRERYAARPDLRKRLRHPVISVGNLAVGGRGKTPLASSIARMLRDAGEKPAILSRGYARARADEGVVVVRDRDGIRADLDRAGDEPLMLARQLPGVSVLVSSDRYLAGRFAEHHLGATVHILDDGFQHLQLERDIDLLIVGRQDVERPTTLPGGRLREPLDTVVAADALLTLDEEVQVSAVGAELPVFNLRRRTVMEPTIEVKAQPVVAVAGIAEPKRFFDDLRASGWRIADALAFRDHHLYTRRNVAGMAESVRRHGASRIVTTEKDYVRLLPFRPFAVPVTYIPIVIEPHPVDEFLSWITKELATVRGDGGG